MERRPRSGADDRDHQPGGFEGFFRELSDLVAAGPPSPHARLEIAERYRLEFAEPSWLPDIIERYNLTPLPADRTRRAPGGECPHVVLTATCGGSVLAASKAMWLMSLSSWLALAVFAWTPSRGDSQLSKAWGITCLPVGRQCAVLTRWLPLQPCNCGFRAGSKTFWTY